MALKRGLEELLVMIIVGNQSSLFHTLEYRQAPTVLYRDFVETGDLGMLLL